MAGQPFDRANLKMNLLDRKLAVDQCALHLADGSVDLTGSIDLQQTFPQGFSPRPKMRIPSPMT
jgi:hypothetical protein